LMLDIMVNKKLVFRGANINEKDDIYQILIESFEPYRKYYTEEGYISTVLSPEEIKKRLKDNVFKVFVVTLDKKIVGTVSIIQKNDSYYIRSMAVDPDYQNQGIGLFILENICNIAENENIKKISLDSFQPLEKAVKFYEKYGFKKNRYNKRFAGK